MTPLPSQPNNTAVPKHYPFILDADFSNDRTDGLHSEFISAKPFNHVVIDNFLSPDHARFLSDNFPKPDNPVWLDWKKRSPHHYGKLGPGNSSKFHLLEPDFKFALHELNSSVFLQFLERVSGIDKLLPDPYYQGGGIHQILHGGILDIHTDFNAYTRLGIFRQLNVIIYLNEQWEPEYGGEFELWNAGRTDGGKCVKSIPPLFNRAVIFKTDKTSFHGHPQEWLAPPPMTRRSVALYYYTAHKLDGFEYTTLTDFQGVRSKDLPQSEQTKPMGRFECCMRSLARLTRHFFPGITALKTRTHEIAPCLNPGDEHYRAYVGPPGDYDLVSAMVFNLLTCAGLRQHHRLLDIGCGSLRVGRLLIPYLNQGNYFGVEPNKWLVEDGIANETGKDLMKLKQPTFHSSHAWKIFSRLSIWTMRLPNRFSAIAAQI